MSTTTLTVRQEVEVLLRAARETAQDRIDFIATLNVAGVAGFHDEVLHELDKVIDAYVNQPAPVVDAKCGFRIGDKVVITGSEFSRESHGVQAGDVVEIALAGDTHWGSRQMRFKDPKKAWGYWCVYSEDIPEEEGGDGDEFDAWGGRVLTPEEQEIKVGDTVRILPLYGEVLGSSKSDVGMEFVVTEVVTTTFEHEVWRADGSGLVSRFYVQGDPGGRGVWEQFIEKVYK